MEAVKVFSPPFAPFVYVNRNNLGSETLFLAFSQTLTLPCYLIASRLPSRFNVSV